MVFRPSSSLKSFTVKGNSLPWYDREVKVNSREQDLGFRKLKNCLNINDQQINRNFYKHLRNEVVNLFRQKKTMKKKLLPIEIIAVSCGKH